PDITHTGCSIPEQTFFRHHGLAIQLQPYQIHRGQPTEEESAFPGRATSVRVGRPARQAGRPFAEVMRWFVIGGGRSDRLGDRLTRIVDAIGRQRPAVVLSGPGNVHLVATARAMLAGPDHAGHWMQRRVLLVAVAIRPYLGPRIVVSDKRVVL